MRLRYGGACRLCGAPLSAGTSAIYERSTRTVRCIDCSPAAAVGPIETPIDPGTPGASARRRYERQHAHRIAKKREQHPRLGAFLLAVTKEPRHTTVWDQGAVGEERLGHRLNELASDTLRVLHDRRIPGTRANIDHLAVTPTGVYVIDAKRYLDQRPALVVEGGLFRPRVEKLLVGGRNRTKLVDGMLTQVDVVRDLVGSSVPITGVLCFIEADWPLLGGALTTRGVEVLWPKKLYPRLTAAGAYGAEVQALHQGSGARTGDSG